MTTPSEWAALPLAAVADLDSIDEVVVRLDNDGATRLARAPLNVLMQSSPATSQYSALKPTVMTPGNLWIIGGDSITNGSGASNFSYSFANHLPAAVGGLVMFQNSIEAGTPGDRSDNLLARLPAAITTYSAKGAVILIGTNDANQSVTLATYATNMTAIFQALKSAGLTAVICTVPPRDTGTSTAIRSLIVQYNHWLKMTAPAWGFEVADVYSVLVDTTTGLLAYDSGDGIHPSQTGHIRITQEVAKAVNRLTRRTTPFGLVVAKDTNVNLVGDPMCVGGTTMPLSWSELGGSGTVPTYSLVSDTTSFLPAGRWAQMDFDAVSGGTRTMRSPGMSSGFSVGDTMLLCGHVQIEDVSGTWVTDLAAKTADVMFSVFDQGAALISASAVSNYCSGIPTTANAAIYNLGPVARTFTVPAATTSLIMTFRVVLPTGKRVKARLGCMGLFNLTTMQMTSYFGSGSMVNT